MLSPSVVLLERKEELTLLDKISRFGLSRNEMTAKDSGPLGSVVDMSDVFLEIGRYFSIPYSSRDCDRDRTPDGAP